MNPPIETAPQNVSRLPVTVLSGFLPPARAAHSSTTWSLRRPFRAQSAAIPSSMNRSGGTRACTFQGHSLNSNWGLRRETSPGPAGPRTSWSRPRVRFGVMPLNQRIKRSAPDPSAPESREPDPDTVVHHRVLFSVAANRHERTPSKSTSPWARFHSHSTVHRIRQTASISALNLWGTTPAH